MRGYRSAIRKLQRSRLIRFSDNSLHRRLPTCGGVYVVIELTRRGACIIYCGKGVNIRQRLYNNLLQGQVRSHTLSGKLIKKRHLADKAAVKKYLSKCCAIRYLEESDVRERTFLEHYAIAYYRCELND